MRISPNDLRKIPRLCAFPGPSQSQGWRIMPWLLWKLCTMPCEMLSILMRSLFHRGVPKKRKSPTTLKTSRAWIKILYSGVNYSSVEYIQFSHLRFWILEKSFMLFEIIIRSKLKACATIRVPAIVIDDAVKKSGPAIVWRQILWRAGFQ